MKITPTLLNYYFNCKTQCWLASRKINMEYNSPLVKVGSALHLTNKRRVKEVRFRGFSVDKIVGDYVVEIKKSDANLLSAKWQLFFYLYKLKELGIVKKGRLEVFEKYKQNTKRQELVLDKKHEQKLLKILEELQKLLSEPTPPKPIYSKHCDKCAYYEYCFI